MYNARHSWCEIALDIVQYSVRQCAFRKWNRCCPKKWSWIHDKIAFWATLVPGDRSRSYQRKKYLFLGLRIRRKCFWFVWRTYGCGRSGAALFNLNVFKDCALLCIQYQCLGRVSEVVVPNLSSLKWNNSLECLTIDWNMIKVFRALAYCRFDGYW